MPAPPCGNYGDINGDGVVNIIDVGMVQNYVADPSTYPLTAEQIKRADVNGDGMVTSADQTMITDYIFGKISTFPVCSGHKVDFFVPDGADLEVK